MINNKKDYYQIHKMTDYIPRSFPLITSEQDALKYLYMIDCTAANPTCVYNIIDYELLIYIELYFQNNEEIQQLLTHIKENIYHSFILKHKYIARITDDVCKNNFPNFKDNSAEYYYEQLGLKEKIKNDKV